MLAMKTMTERPQEPSAQSSRMPPIKVCSARCSAETVLMIGSRFAGT